jgi:hypothetical protein
MPIVTIASPQGKRLLAGRPGIDFRQGQRFFFITYHVQGDFLRRKMPLCNVQLDFNRTGFGVFFYLLHEADSF